VFEVTCVAVVDCEDLWKQIFSYRQRRLIGCVSKEKEDRMKVEGGLGLAFGSGLEIKFRDC
jgi:hypothetical protein